MADIERYINEVYTGINTNVVSTCTAWIDITSCEHLAFYVEGKSGTHASHKVGLEMSPDGIFNGGFHMDNGTIITIDGVGHKHIVDVESISFVRLCVQTAEGATSTCDFYIQAFRHD